jgi:hypothetical protein
MNAANTNNLFPTEEPDEATLLAQVPALRTWLDAASDEALPFDEEILDRYASGRATVAERELVDLERRLSPAFARQVDELTAFADSLRGYDWNGLAARRAGLRREGAAGRAARFGREVVERITRAVETLAEPLRVRSVVLQHATEEDPDATLRQPLVFEGGRALGSFVHADEGVQIHIEHEEWPAGTLALFELLDAAGEPLTQRFVVLKDDWERASVDLETPALDAATCRVALRSVDAAALDAETAGRLVEDFRQAVGEDPEAAAAWALWAEAAAEAGASPAAVEAAERIRGIGSRVYGVGRQLHPTP